MIYLLILFTILFFLYLTEVKGKRAWTLPGCYIVWLLFVLVAGLRYRVGGDSLYYQDIYPSLPSFGELKNYGLYENGYGPLWYLFCAATKAIDSRFVVMQIVHALIINTAMVYFFNKYSKHLFACLLVYYVFYYLYFNMEILRESLAIAVFLPNMKNLVNKRWTRYVLGSIVSLGFHLSAIVLFILPLLMKMLQKKHIKPALTILMASIAGLLFILQNMADDLEFLPLILLTKMHSYGTREMNNINGIINDLLPFLAYWLVYWVHARLQKREAAPQAEQRTDLLFKAFLFFAFLGGFNEGIFRFTNYLTPLAVAYAVNVVYRVAQGKGMRKQMNLLVSCLAFLILFAHKSYYYYKDTSPLADHTRRYELWYPYESVFTRKEHYGRELIFYNATHNLIDLRNKN